MKIENYVFHYDENGQCTNKLCLQNLDDVRNYVEDFVKTQFLAKFTGNIIKFLSDGKEVEFSVEKC